MLRAWIEQHWQYPYLVEDTHLETTTLFMPTISLSPKEIQDSLEELFGKEYVKLDKDERLALILSFVDGEIANARLSDIGAIHPADSSKILKKLVDKKLLISDGVGRGTKYYINKLYRDIKVQPLASEVQPKELEVQLSENIISIQNTQRASKNRMIEAILELCTNRYLTKNEIANLLNRDATTIRNKYLTQMVKDGRLALKHEEVNHKDQAYTKVIL